MSYEFYKTLHILGIAMLFLAFGGLAGHALNGGTRETNRARGLMVASHGLGLILILVAGFGMLAKMGGSNMFPGWIHPKLLIWLLMGAAIMPLQRKPSLARPLWTILPLLALAAAYLALHHS
ncbi:MAG: hypothetical protein H6710_24510 [Myxococcales bacterium]|nr:hypothetical protein [Myxococcales bacterium]MCB9702376.1 hypothetical protein [Myxococcales bacterium]